MRRMAFGAGVVVVALVGVTGTGGAPARAAVGTGGGEQPVTVNPLNGTGALRDLGDATNHLGSFDIVINPNASLSSNAPALAAFNRAAAQWEAWIADPITINISAGLAVLTPGVIGSTSQTLLGGAYADVRTALIGDAADETDDAIVNSIPASGTTAFPAASFPSGSFSGVLAGTRSNFKAIGGIDANDPATDATITFNSNFNFDFDRSNGIGAGLLDFETVAAHEIGHALGFTSWVDQIDLGNAGRNPALLDLFRFDNGGATDPATAADFATMRRSLVPGNDEVFDEIADEWRMSTGQLTGDGRQASHWKDNDLTGILLGIMDPTLGNQQTFTITTADLRALDLIGYEISIPEPGALTLAAGAAGLLLLRRRRSRPVE